METKSKRCFVTVGTTSFDKLIHVLNDDSIRNLLVERFGITHLTIQYGRGKTKPSVDQTVPGLVVSAFDFKPSLAEDMRSADLIISHAGAGSIMEALRLGKPLIVVVNDDLMDNHQIELATAMARGQYLSYSPNAAALKDALATVDTSTFKRYPARDTSKFAQVIYEELGIS